MLFNYRKMKVNIFLIIALTTLLYSCNEESKNIIAEPNWTEVDAAKSNVVFSNDLTPNIDNNILEYLYYFNGGGVGIGDINQDGLEDIFLTANEKKDRLYINKGNFQFEDISASAGISDAKTWSSGVSIDDINQDGFLDIYVCKVSGVGGQKLNNELYLNNGNGTFTESATIFGLDFSGYSTQSSFFDYDNDGDLDMYLLNHSVHSPRSYGKTDKRVIADPLSGDKLYENRLNEKEGKFVDVTKQSNIYSSALGYGLCVITTDINGDHLTDIYVGNDFHENDYVYINQGDGTFVESMNKMLTHTAKFTMGVDIADMNQDGMVDIFTTDMLPYQKTVAMKSAGEDTDQIFNIRKDFGFEDQYARNNFHLQTDVSQFQDIALKTETYATDWSWSVLLQDFDNDSDRDIFITNGILHRPNDLDYINYLNSLTSVPSTDEEKAKHLKDMLANMPSEPLANVLFTQEGDLKFSNVKESLIGSPNFSNGAAYADLDNDGDLDIVTNNINAPASILRNDQAAKNYLKVNLNNTIDKASTKNAHVSIHSADTHLSSAYITTRGYQSSSTHELHFGLGQMSNIDSVTVVWPDKSYQIIRNPSINQLLTIEKENNRDQIKAKTNQSTTKPLVFPYKHDENKYDDHNLDKLIPEYLSREGPAVVSADFTGDGQKDIFIGGARYQEPVLYVAKADGTYTLKSNRDFRIDAKYEDTDATTIDFDNDGDLDLYVVSGGNQSAELDKLLEDRLYLNDGKGNLKRIPLSLPHTNGSTVSVADYDGDGYEDLFVGARSIPFSYGLSPFSFVLKNNSGTGVSIAYKERYGMLTDSQWADYDGDKDLDLIICGDWSSLAILENQGNGILQYTSDKLGLKHKGLWNAIATYDYNNDGRLDILVANAGENLKWKTNYDDNNTDVKMYVLDMDGNGQTEPLIFYDYFGNKMPYASLEKLASQIPIIKKQFTTYKSFSEVSSLSDIKASQDKQIVEDKTINEMKSILYLSKDSIYVPYALDNKIQLSTVQDFKVMENGDVIYISNYRDYLTALGKNSGNSGGILRDFSPEEKSFLGHESLSLSPNLNTRQIIHLSESNYLVICNNDYPYIVDIRK